MYQSHRLRILQELALRGTLAAVAEALSYSPSTISHQLAQLEKEAGVRLLEPDGRRVRLTPQGEALAAHARRMLDLEEEIEQELKTRPGRTTVRTCIMQSAARTLLPDALGRLAEAAPGVRLELKELTPEEGLVELLARGLDLVIAEQYPGHSREHRKGTRRTTLGRDRMRIALPRGDGANGLVDLADRPWVLLPAQMHAHHWAVQQCRAAGFEPDVKFEVADLATHVQLITSGHAVGILPDLLWANTERPVRLVDLPGDADREIFLATRAASFSNQGIASVSIAFQQSFEAYSKPA